MVNKPQDAGRLSYVCKAWNTVVDYESTMSTVIMHNPTHYAQNLTNAGCKKLNKNQVLASEEENTETSFSISDSHDSDSESSSAHDSDSESNEAPDVNAKDCCTQHARRKLLTIIIVGSSSGLGTGIGCLVWSIIPNPLGWIVMPVGAVSGAVIGGVARHCYLVRK